MNKVLILTLMMLSFVSKVEESQGKTITKDKKVETKNTTRDEKPTEGAKEIAKKTTTPATKAAKQIQQDTSKNSGKTKKPKQNTTTAPTTIRDKKLIKTKKLNEAKEEETIIPGEIEAILATIEDEKLIKTKKLNEAKGGASFLTQHKKKILFTAAFLAFLAIIFGIYYLKGEKSQQTSGQKVKANDTKSTNEKQQREQQQQFKLIKKNFKNKPWREIIEGLGLKEEIIPLIKIHDLKALNLKITTEEEEKFKDTEIKAMIEAINTRNMPYQIYSVQNKNSQNLEGFIRHYTLYFINNTPPLTWIGDGGFKFYDNKSEGDKITCFIKDDKGELITKKTFDYIKNSIDARFKVLKMILNQNAEPNNLTFKEIELLGIDCHSILEKTPLEANEYIEPIKKAIEETPENNTNTIEELFKARSDIEKAIQESNELKKLDLCLGFNSDLGCFVLCDVGDYQSCGGKNNNHIKPGGSSTSLICSYLYSTKDLKETAEAQTLKNTPEKICEIIGELNTKEINGKKLTDTWLKIKNEINDLLKKSLS